VNCAAGASLTGDAVCNDGWISSVPYSETDECSSQNACNSPVFVASTVAEYTAANQSMRTSIKNIIASGITTYNNLTGTIQQTANQTEANINAQIQSVNAQNNTSGGDCSTNSPANISNSTYGGLQAYEQQEQCQEAQNLETERQNTLAELNATLAQAQASEQASLLQVNQCLTNFNTVQNDFVSIDQQATQQQTVPAPIMPPALTPQPEPTPSAPSSTPSSSELFSINSNIKFGQSGANVATLQNFLESKGFLTLPAGIAEGYFGNLTKQALIAFQQSAGLPNTGFCGAMTRAIINSAQ
jgi:Putative peptidoglycan binding domain